MPRQTGFEETADDLYGLPRLEFTAARDAAAGAARTAGDAELAAAIRKMRRPTASAWLANALVRDRGREIAQLIDIGNRIRTAQAELDGGALRRLSEQRRDLVAELSRDAARRSATRRSGSWRRPSRQHPSTRLPRRNCAAGGSRRLWPTRAWAFRWLTTAHRRPKRGQHRDERDPRAREADPKPAAAHRVQPPLVRPTRPQPVKQPVKPTDAPLGRRRARRDARRTGPLRRWPRPGMPSSASGQHSWRPRQRSPGGASRWPPRNAPNARRWASTRRPNAMPDGPSSDWQK